MKLLVDVSQWPSPDHWLERDFRYGHQSVELMYPVVWKKIGHRRYLYCPNPVPRVLELALSELGAKKVAMGYILPDLELNRRKLLEIPNVELKVPDRSRPTYVNFHFLSKLFPFQKEAFWFMACTELPGGILNLSPGLGKTVVTAVYIKYLQMAADVEPLDVLIVCPKILVPVWEREIKKWTRVTLSNCWGRPAEGRWVVTTYETLHNPSKLETYLKHRWNVLIIDESSRVKNRDTRTFETLLKVREQSDKVWLLSGTPITRFTDDLWSQFHLIWPEAFRSYWRFANRYCYIDETIWGKKIIGSREIEEGEFSDLMISIQQREVLDLPDLRFETIETPLSDRQLEVYQTMLDTFIVELEEGRVSAPSKLAQMIRLQQITSGLANIGGPDHSAKSDAIQELLTQEEFPVLIWSHWRQGALALYERLKPYLAVEIIQGGHPDPDAVITAFQEGVIDVLILSLDVGQFGLTLTRAMTVIYLDKTFEMESFIQSLYRVKRIGLEHSPKVISLVAPNTIDQLVADNLATKAIDINRITNEDLLTLLRVLKGESDEIDN